MIRKIAILFGLGGSMFDPAGGEVALVARCKAIGLIRCRPFGYADSQGIYDFLKDADWRAIVGDSFGADFEVNDFGHLPIDYCRVSSHRCTPTTCERQITLPSNITAHCIRDPEWIDTDGLGYANWVAADPKKTRLLTTEHRGAHPDDTGYAQDLVFAEVKQLVGA